MAKQTVDIKRKSHDPGPHATIVVATRVATPTTRITGWAPANHEPCTSSPREGRGRITDLQSNALKRETPLRRRRCPTQMGLGFRLKNEIRGWTGSENSTTVPSRRGAAPAGLATAVGGDINQGFLPVPTDTTATSYQQNGKEHQR